MRFEAIAITNLRCLETLEFEPDEAVSLVWGDNGSGKTSLLEGFALASLGKSFLSNRVRDIVRLGTDGLSVRALLAGEAAGHFRVTVKKTREETAIAIDGVPVMAASALAQRVPLIVIDSRVGGLLTDSPSNRRALVDRTMFHVEPAYIEAWKRYRQALRQRNELLRRNAARSEAEFWNQELERAALEIDRCRCRVVEVLNGALAESPLVENFGPITLHYLPGWDRDTGLARQLAEQWERDRALGFTAAGVHRADLSLKGGGRSIARHLSRGQSKFTVCQMLVGLAAFIEAGSGRKPVMLVDDLAAELDDKMRAWAVDIIDRQGGQRIYTAIRPTELPEIADQAAAVFHVKPHASEPHA